MDFTSFGIDQRLITQLDVLDIKSPSPIQEKAIAAIKAGKDIIGIAPTGSGKTFAYLLPIMDWVMNAKIPHDNPTVMILVPTRELVRQLAVNIKQLAGKTEIFHVSIFAGQNLNKLERQFDGIIDIILATPGRLMEYVKEGKIVTSMLKFIVIDELDRLLDMGFDKDLEEIFTYCPPIDERTTLLFGATLPRRVEKVAKRLQYNSETIEIGRSEIPKSIRHEVYETLNPNRMETLLKVLKRRDMRSVLIFTPSQENARNVVKQLGLLGLEVEELHSGLTQRQRNLAIGNFSSGEVSVMVATDIGARGLDIEDISHIISMNVPKLYNDYVHRAGRTGRAEKKGVSIMLADPSEFGRVRVIERHIQQSIPRKTKLSPFEIKSERGSKKSGGNLIDKKQKTTRKRTRTSRDKDKKRSRAGRGSKTDRRDKYGKESRKLKRDKMGTVKKTKRFKRK